MEFIWVEKGRRGRRPNQKLVTVNVRKDGCVAFIFLNKAEEKISKTGYVQIGFSEDDTCIGFRETTKENGYKISTSRKSNPTTKFHLKESDLDKYRGFEGVHILNTDLESGTYFIRVDEVES